MVQAVMSDVACSRVSNDSWSRGSRGVDCAFRGTPLWAQTRPDRPISDDFSGDLVCHFHSISSRISPVSFFSFPTLDHVKDRNRAGKCKQGKGSSSLNIDFWHLSPDSFLILCSFQYHWSYSMPFIIWSHNILSYECFLHIHFSCCVNLYITLCINRMLVE